MASAVPGMRFDGETRPDSHPDSWASFKRSYAYGWSLQRDLCNAAKEAMDARLAVTGSKSAALADKAKVLYLQSMQAYHKAVHATLSPKALQRIEQLLGNAAFAEAGPDALIKASDTLFNMPIASESYDERLRRLSLSESTSMAELVMDIHAVSTIGLSMSYPALTPDDVSDFNAKLQANLDSSFSEAPFDSTAVVEEPTRFFPRIWLAIHDQVVDRAVAARVARACCYRSRPACCMAPRPTTRTNVLPSTSSFSRASSSARSAAASACTRLWTATSEGAKAARSRLEAVHPQNGRLPQMSGRYTPRCCVQTNTKPPTASRRRRKRNEKPSCSPLSCCPPVVQRSVI